MSRNLKSRIAGVLPELLAFACVYAFMVLKVDFRLVFDGTILTGGDSISWLQPLEQLRDVLLPAGRLFGWNLSNFFGYSEGQYYFPLPFLSGALLSYIVPVRMALKIVTLAGIFALPAAFYSTARRICPDRWVALAAPALSLLFIYNESYTMYGGNFLSTLAGEFCYSWAIALFVLFIGRVWDCFERGRSPAPAGLLLALIALSHAFVFMVAFLLPFFFAFGKESFRAALFRAPDEAKRPAVRETAARLLAVYALGLALSAFWFLPMIATRTWAATIPMLWRFASFGDFLSQTLFPALVAAIAFAAMTVAKGRERRLGAFLLYSIGCCVFLFVGSSFLEVPDIRFVPPALILSLLAVLAFMDFLPSGARPRTVAAGKSGRGGGRRASKRAVGPEAQTGAPHYPQRSLNVLGASLPLAALLAAALYPASMIASSLVSRNVRTWFAWNYSGIEAKKEWPRLEKMAVDLSGGSGDGRVLYEKPNQRDSADFGSERIFENLRHFTGRGTAEGIHYGSSFMARASTYLQSEYSLNPVDPEPDRVYSVVNPEVWPLRFDQLNVRDIIVFSPEMKAKFMAAPGFRERSRFGKYSVFSYDRFPGGYVEIADPSMLAAVGEGPGGFKSDFYRWFRDYELVRHPFVPRRFADADFLSRFPVARNYDDFAAERIDSGDFRAYVPDRSGLAGEKVDDLAIEFATESPGKPHLIKISYSPNFRSVGGERIYPVSPGFMLIFPASKTVRIEYGRGAWEIAGALLTLAAIPVAFLVGRAKKLSLRWEAPFLALAMMLFLAGLVVLLAGSLGGTRKMIADCEAAERAASRGKAGAERALALVRPYNRGTVLERYDNMLAARCILVEARVLASRGQAEEAKQLYARLERRFRHSRLVADLQLEIARLAVKKP